MKSIIIAFAAASCRAVQLKTETEVQKASLVELFGEMQLDMSQFKKGVNFQLGGNYDPALLLLRLAADKDNDGVVRTSDIDDLFNFLKV